MSNVLLAGVEHLSLVAEQERLTFKQPWSENALSLFVGNDGFCAICMDDDRLMSYCTVTVVLDEAQIINVATNDSYKGQGCAKKTLNFVLEECKKRNIVSISLEVRESNVPAMALYEGLGFLTAGKRRAFYSDPREDALVMVKNLA